MTHTDKTVLQGLDDAIASLKAQRDKTKAFIIISMTTEKSKEHPGDTVGVGAAYGDEVDLLNMVINLPPDLLEKAFSVCLDLELIQPMKPAKRSTIQ